MGCTYNDVWIKLGVPKLIENSDGTLEAIAPNTAIGMNDGNEFISAMSTGDQIIKDEHDALSALVVAEALLEDSFEVMDSAGAATEESATSFESREERFPFGKKLAAGLVCASVLGAGIGIALNPAFKPNLEIDLNLEMSEFTKTATVLMNNTNDYQINNAKLNIFNETGFSVFEKSYTSIPKGVLIEESVNMTTLRPGEYTIELTARRGLLRDKYLHNFNLPNLNPFLATSRVFTVQTSVDDIDLSVFYSLGDYDSDIIRKQVNIVDKDNLNVLELNDIDPIDVNRAKTLNETLIINKNNWDKISSLALSAKVWDADGGYIEILSDLNIKSEPRIDLIFEPVSEIGTDGYFDSLEQLVGSIKMPRFKLTAEDELGIRDVEIKTLDVTFPFQNWSGVSQSGILPNRSLVTDVNIHELAGYIHPRMHHPTQMWITLSSILPDGNVTFMANMTRWNGEVKTIFKNITVPNFAPFVDYFTTIENSTTGEVIIQGYFIDLEGRFRSHQVYAINDETNEKTLLDSWGWHSFYRCSWSYKKIDILQPGEYSFEAHLRDWEGNYRNVTLRNKLTIPETGTRSGYLPESNSDNLKENITCPPTQEFQAKDWDYQVPFSENYKNIDFPRSMDRLTVIRAFGKAKDEDCL